ncbi:MAG: amino acid adenylation domain-containing protein [Candidatus Aminicenantes bacterium]|jgi:amino acid adenylation domain-containing protein
MSTQKNRLDLDKEPELSGKKNAVLEKLLKGQILDKLNVHHIPKRKIFSPVPLSFGQRRLWIIDQLVPGKAFYNVNSVFRIKGRLDIPVFERSFHQVIQRHESLRTTFNTREEEPVQVIWPELKQELGRVDLRHFSREEQEKEIMRLAFEEVGKPFDLKKGPLLRMTLLHLNPEGFILLLSMHHIISDTWSLGVLVKELVTIYIAFSEGKPSPLPEPSIQYADFALWQRERMQGRVLAKQLAYWRAQLAQDLPVLELPTDHQRPAVQTFNGGSQIVLVSRDLCEKLLDITRQQQCSLFMVLLAAFNVLLYYYSGQDDILVGSPIANRNRIQLEGLIGYLSNTLVFRTHLTGNPGFRQLLGRIREITAGAYDNQDFPFEKMVEEFQPDRYMSHTPLFQVMLVLLNVPGQVIHLPGLEVSPMTIHNKTCKFDLALSLVKEDNILSGMIEYNTDIFEAPTITRLISHFKTLLESITTNQEQPINELSILSHREKEQLLTDWNNTYKDYSLQCIYQSFQDQVKRTPDHTALLGNVDGGKGRRTHLSYRELNKKSNQLANRLNEKGVKSDTIVSIMIERSVEMVIGLLGILTAGGAYLPLDPEYPRERMNYMLVDSSTKFLLVISPAQVNFGVKRDSIEIIDLSSRLSYSASTTTSGLAASEVNLAYMIYTSGSTGKPKGVMISHEGISNRLLWMQEAFGLTTDDRILQKTPFGFDVSVWEFFWPLLNGAGLVMARPGGHKDSAYLVDIIDKQKITTLHFVPSMLNVFLEDPAIQHIRSLKRVICSGEVLPVEYQQRFFKIIGKDVELHNLYGPTEASVDVTHWSCSTHDTHNSVPLGRPIANTRIYILDQNSGLVPIGVPGELHIGGIQLARGYLNNPELTAEKFILAHSSWLIADRKAMNGAVKFPMSYQLSAFSCIYKSGDLARWVADGNIEFLGRLDFQVKVRGFRIELGEIESKLRNHPGLDDAVVLVRENGSGSTGKKLTAYVVPNRHHWTSSKEKSGIAMDQAQVSEWQGVFDDTYDQESSTQDPLFNISGWNSSYTGQPLPAEEMRQWVDSTADRILSLKPKRVLEIGCGTGLLLFKILPHLRFYLGTDISKRGLDYIRNQLDARKGSAKVELLNKPAVDFQDIEQSSFDLVVLNSVVQYFPGIDYLLKVLEKAAKVVKPGGYIFIGDVRILPLLKAFHASVEFHRGASANAAEMTGNQLNRRVMKRILQEKELVIDPDFFIALKEKGFAGIKHAQIHLKQSTHHNELTKFRCDVILRIGSGDTQEIDISFLDWQRDNLTLSGVRQRLMKEKPQYLGIAGIPNARVSEDLGILKWLKNQDSGKTIKQWLEIPLEQRRIGTAPGAPVDPEDFWKLAEKFSYDIDVYLSPSGTLDSDDPGEVYLYNVVFKRPEPAGSLVYRSGSRSTQQKCRPWAAYANNPLLTKMSGELVPELKHFLKEKLPEYMVPSYVVLLNRFPLTPSGKLDRKALPSPELFQFTQANAAPGEEKGIVNPRTETEKFFAAVWAEVLGVDKVGINNNFFEWGGDSVNAIRVISRVNKQGFQLSLQDLYKNQTVEDLVRAAGKKKQPPKAGVKAEASPDDWLMGLDREVIVGQLQPGTEIEDIYPATPLQCHMINYLENHSDDRPELPLFIYQRRYLPIPVNLDLSILKRALQKAVAAYAILRTVLVWKHLKEPVQVVCATITPDIIFRDFSHLAPHQKNQAVAELMEEEWKRGHLRHQNMPFRLVVVKLGQNLSQYFFTADYSRMDGWGGTYVLQYIMDCYEAFISGGDLEPETNNYYKSYLLSLKKRDVEKAKKYWLSVFDGFTTPISLIKAFPGNTPGQEKGFAQQHVYLPAEIMARLDRILRQERLVFSVVAKAIWGLIISRCCNREEVVFGFLTTGRSVASAGIEFMSGHAINILPLRMKITPEKLLVDWLRELLDHHMEWAQYEYTQIETIYECLGISTEQPLFETFMVVQNITRERATDNSPSQQSRQFGLYHAKMEYPLRVDLYPGIEICLVFNYYRSYFTDAVINGLMRNFQTLMESISTKPNQTLAELMKRIPAQSKVNEKKLLEKKVWRIQ